MEQVVIIGNGIAGITAARHIRKLSEKRIIVISAESDYFFSRTALMYVFMGHMKFKHIKPYEDGFWKKNRIELKNAYVQKITTEEKKLQTSAGEEIFYDQLILATGSTTNMFGWKGSDAEGVQGLISKQDLELLEKNTASIEQGVIVGGGLIGVELAEMLHTRKIDVTLLVREKAFWASTLPLEEAELISRHIESHGIEILRETELEEIIADDENQVKAIRTKAGKELKCQWVGLATGVKPNIEFLKGSGIETDKGILVNRKLETNIPDVYAVGDCAQQRRAIGKRKLVEAVWYTARMMGETLAQTICGNPTEYKPGNWFNSAKFFDIEYQTYGWVFPELEEGYDDFYWEHAEGERCLHFVFEKESRKFTGVNTFGIRLRHEIIDHWLTESKTIDEVIDSLKKANFDKEFSKKYEKQIRRCFLERQTVDA